MRQTHGGILSRHISYFADEDGLNGLLQHIGEENAFYQRFKTLPAALVQAMQDSLLSAGNMWRRTLRIWWAR
jgi:hypothetical protein